MISQGPRVSSPICRRAALDLMNATLEKDHNLEVQKPLQNAGQIGYEFTFYSTLSQDFGLLH